MNSKNWQRRWHILLQEWVLIAANTQSRPISQGELKADVVQTNSYYAQCYLCPNNTRSSGVTNPDYQQTFVFENDFPSLAINAPIPNKPISSKKNIERVEHLQGECRVVCFDPQHNIVLADLSIEKII